MSSDDIEEPGNSIFRSSGFISRWNYRQRSYNTQAILIFSALNIGVIASAGKQRQWLGPSNFISGAPSKRSNNIFASIEENLYVFGGANAAGFLGDLYRYNPATLQWVDLSSLVDGDWPGPRTYACADVVRGQLYVFAGQQDGAVRLKDMHIFDPSRMAWSDVTTLMVGDVPGPRSCSAIAAAGDKLYVYGGFDGTGVLRDTRRFDPETLEWTDLSQQVTGAFLNGRACQSMTSYSGKLLMFGGFDEYGAIIGGLSRFDPSTLQWTDIAPTQAAQAGSRAFLSMSIANDILVIFGGLTDTGVIGDTFVFNMSSLTTINSSNVSGSPPPDLDQCASSAIGQKVFLFGGSDATSTVFLDEFRVFDVSTLGWADLGGQLGGSSPPGRNFPGFASIDSDLYVFGGNGVLGSLNDLHRFDTETLQWSELTLEVTGDIPQARQRHALTSWTAKLCLFGGIGDAGVLNDLFLFEPQSLRWIMLSQTFESMPAARAGHGLASILDKLFLFGGHDGSGFFGDLHSFDFSTLKWTNLSQTSVNAPCPRAYFGFTASGGKLWVFGGQSIFGNQTSAGNILGDFFRFDPTIMEWEELVPQTVSGVFPAARAHLGFTSIGTALFIFGGLTGSGSITDIYMFDHVRMRWTEMSQQIQGTPPFARFDHGFTSCQGKLFIFGGYGGLAAAGVLLNDLTAVVAPSDVSWPINGGLDFFLNFYDWDLMLLDASAPLHLDFRMNLCTRFFPCSLSIYSDDQGLILKTDNGSIACLASNGCSALSVNSVSIHCDGQASSASALEMQGGYLEITRSNFFLCASHVDGGAVQSYSGAVVTITSSTFQSTYSLASGGAVSIVGGTLLVQNSSFSNCSSSSGGGAIAAQKYQCYMSDKLLSTALSVAGSSFVNCTSETGGAIAVYDSVQATVNESMFSFCSSKASGGAISLSNLAIMQVTDCVFRDNSASGMGGGALYAQNAILDLKGISCERNIAARGGGGVLYWDGAHQPLVDLFCEAGYIPVGDTLCEFSDCVVACGPCSSGSFQTARGGTSCWLCEAGKFSSLLGASSVVACLNCDHGKYSTVSGANSSNVCEGCRAGTYATGVGNSICNACAAGKYSSTVASMSSFECINCPAGKFSNLQQANRSDFCKSCNVGTYSDVNSTSCMMCPLGTYSTGYDAASVTTCVNCAAGKYSTVLAADHSDVCLTCEPGTFPAGKHFTYNLQSLTWFGANEECERSGGVLASIDSYEENLALLDLLPQNMDFWIGYYYSEITEKWQFMDIDNSVYSNWANGNPKKERYRYFCADFPTYAVTDTDGAASYTLAGVADLYRASWPYFTEEYGLIAAIRNPSPAGSWYNFDCFNGFHWVNGYVCSIAASSSCRECTAGKYSSNGGASSIADCISCSAGKFSYDGATSCTACTLENSTSHGREPNCTDSTSFSTSRKQSQINKGLQISKLEQTKQKELNGKMKFDSSRPISLDNIKNTFGVHRNKMQSKSDQDVISKKISATDQLSSKAKQILPSNTIALPINSAKRRISDSRMNSIPSICGIGNAAKYGTCLASSFQRLDLLGVPNEMNPASPGIQFSLTVLKKDAYGQTIATDSSSLIQAQSVLADSSQPDPYVSLSGITVASLSEGMTVLSLLVFPTYSLVVPASGLTLLSAIPRILVKGVDSQATTFEMMESDSYYVDLSNGTSICPRGYILELSTSKSFNGSAGYCTKCASGTYSINPLVGETLDKSSCLNCPPSGVCEGGDDVKFSFGMWVLSDGIYRLIGCPAGYQLINSVNDVFSHDIQQCLACGPQQYILDSNQSKYTCQNCPVGAICDGSTLKGRVAGSVWVADWSAGRYTLQSCPAGYELEANTQDAQQCSLCAAAYYCLGGASPSAACPEGTFSSPGANSSKACLNAIFVSVSVVLPLTSADFTEDKQNQFQSAISAATGVPLGQILLQSATEMRRSRLLGSFKSALKHDIVPEYKLRSIDGEDSTSQLFGTHEFHSEELLVKFSNLNIHPIRSKAQEERSVLNSRRAGTTSILVMAKIAAADAASASAVASKLNTQTLDTELVARNLPEASSISVTIQTFSSSTNTGPSIGLIAGVACGGFVILWALVAGGIVLWRKVRIQAARKAFLTAFRTAKSGATASPDNLPYEMRKIYSAQKILGKGAFGCVLQAETRQGGRPVAIKLIVPEKGTFDDKELRQMRREAAALELFTLHNCEHAVRLSGAQAVFVSQDICWLVMEFLDGQNVEEVIYRSGEGPLADLECIKAARSVLAALKVMHSEGLVHRDIKPANVVRSRLESSGQEWDGQTYAYKLVDFGTTLGVDETVAKEAMMTLAGSRQMGAGTLPYMSPEMFKEPERATYPTDLWSLGVTLFEAAAGCLPFQAESDLLWVVAVAGDMQAKAPSVLDQLPEGRRARFDHKLAKVIDKALEKRVEDRYLTADEMHEAVYGCLIDRGEACYSVFISYRVDSEAPFARLLFDDLNHTVTPGGHRVTVYWDAHRLVKGEGWEESFATGLLNSLCVFPLLSYGSTAPLAALPDHDPAARAALLARGWDERPMGRRRLHGAADDPEDNVLKEMLITSALLERCAAADRDPVARTAGEKGILQLAFPVLIGRQEPPWHPDYPRMGDFFAVQAGGGTYPTTPSGPSNEAVARFLAARAGLPEEALAAVRGRSVAAAVQALTSLQGCRMWAHPADLPPAPLTKEQRELIGRGYAGPAVSLSEVGAGAGGDGGGGQMTEEQAGRCRGGGLDEAQVAMLKAEIRARRPDFHEIIDRAVCRAAGRNGIPGSLHAGGEAVGAAARRKSSQNVSAAVGGGTGSKVGVAGGGNGVGHVIGGGDGIGYGGSGEGGRGGVGERDGRGGEGGAWTNSDGTRAVSLSCVVTFSGEGVQAGDGVTVEPSPARVLRS